MNVSGVDIAPVFLWAASNPHNLAIAKAAGLSVTGWVDDIVTGEYMRLPVRKITEVPPGSQVVNCVCSCMVARKEVYEKILARGCEPLSLISPEAYIYTPRLQGVRGLYIQEFVSVQAGATVGDNCTLHSGAMLGERTYLGAHSFVGPGAQVCGRCFVGEQVYIGAGAVILPDITIGAGSIVGAGSVVTRYVAAGTIVVGNPARILSDSRDLGGTIDPRKGTK